MTLILAAYRVLRDAYREFEKDDGIAMAGYIAFSGLLAIFPFLIFAVGLTGVVVGPERSQEAIDTLFLYAPPHVAQTLEPVLLEVLKERGQGFLTFSILITIWVASNIFEAFRVAFDRAYNVEDKRNFVVRRGISIGFVFLGALVAAILGISVVFLPIWLSYASTWTNLTIPGIAVAVTFGLGLLTFIIFLLIMHNILPAGGNRGKRTWPGVLISVGMWIVVAMGFSLYLSFAPSYAITYGALAGVIVTLLFFYLTGLTIIYGAEVNAVLNAAEDRSDAPQGM